MTDPILDVRGLRKVFGAETALERVDLAVASGEFLTLLGPSGSGKTTLLRIIAGFERPTEGRVLLRGRDISGMSPAERGLGMVFQHYALFPHLRVEENIAYGLRLRRWPRDRIRRRVGEMIELLHLEGLERRYPRELSGGQQQRVALGRALAYDPQIILMDEPLGALDRALRLEMAAELRRIHRDLRATVIHVTHDQQEALALSDRIAVMHLGRIVGIGAPDELYRTPPNAFVARFFAGANLLPVEEGEILPGGMARVRVGGAVLTCRTTAEAIPPAALAIRPRTLRPEVRGAGLAVEGTVIESVLLGDGREITLDVPGVGKVSAVVEARGSTDLEIGSRARLFAPAEDVVLVPLDEVGGSPGPNASATAVAGRAG